MEVNKKDQAFVKGIFELEKIPGKGGWIFARLPGIKTQAQTPFGWRQVKGSVDGYHFSAYKLMPMGNGELFFPVKASVRKKIGKSVGDSVFIELYDDSGPMDVPEELMECLEEEGHDLVERFLNLDSSDRDRYIKWIYEHEDLDKRAERILKLIDAISY
jgi:hypothetical protein